MLVSIIMPIYNTPTEWLVQSIESILIQTYTDFQLLLIDDFSTDSNIERICRMFCEKDSRIEYYKLEINKGISSALNFGLEKCNSEWVLRMDSDDIMFNNRIEKQMEYIRKYPNVDILGTGLYYYVLDVDNKWKYNPKVTSHPNIITKDYVKKSDWIINHPTVLFRKSKIDYLGGYDEKLIGLPEDYDLWCRSSKEGYVIHNIQEPLLFLRLSPNSLSKKFDPKVKDFFLKCKSLL